MDYSIDLVPNDSYGNVYYNLEDDISNIYVEVEYIENTSNAYINTGIAGTGSQKIECVFLPVKKTTNEYNCVYGARTSPGKQDGIYIYSINSSSNYGYVAYNTTTAANVLAASIGVKHTLIQNKGSFTLDGTTIKNHTNATFTASANIFIFDGSNGNTPGNYRGYIRIFSFKIYNGSGVLVRDFVPVIKLSTKKYGLYDKINRVFYVSPNGTEFIGSTSVNLDSSNKPIIY